MLSEKFEKNFLILEFPYNIGICTNIAHTNSLHPPNIAYIYEASVTDIKDSSVYILLR